MAAASLAGFILGGGASSRIGRVMLASAGRLAFQKFVWTSLVEIIQNDDRARGSRKT